MNLTASQFKMHQKEGGGMNWEIGVDIYTL